MEATGPNGAVVSFSPTATDSGDALVGIVVSPLSGSIFPLGTTTVHVEASPAGGTEPAGGNSGKSRKGKAGGDGEELVSVDRAMGRRGRRAGRTVKTRKGEVGPRRRKDGEGRIVRVLGRKTAGSRKAKRLARAARIAS